MLILTLCPVLITIFLKNIFHPNKHVIAPKAIKLCVHYWYGIVCYYFAFTILRDDLLSGWRRSPGAISLFANDLSTVISGIYCGIWALLLALCSRSWKQIPTIIWRKNDYHLRVSNYLTWTAPLRYYCYVNSLWTILS